MNESTELLSREQRLLLYCDNCRRPQGVTVAYISTPNQEAMAQYGGFAATWTALACTECRCLHGSTVRLVLFTPDGPRHPKAEADANVAYVQPEQNEEGLGDE